VALKPLPCIFTSPSGVGATTTDVGDTTVTIGAA